MMGMQRFFLLGSLVFLSGCTWLTRFNPPPNPDPNHTHADFAVWIEGERMDFSAAKYMSSQEPGGEDHEKHGHKHDYLHLHDGIGHVVHRHKPGLSVGEFFASLGFRMELTCVVLDTKKRVCNQGEKQWRMYVHRELQSFDPGYVFADTDKILLTYGSGGDQVARELATMTEDACRYSKTCPWKGAPPVENCIADPAVPCMGPLD